MVTLFLSSLCIFIWHIAVNSVMVSILVGIVVRKTGHMELNISAAVVAVAVGLGLHALFFRCDKESAAS